MTVNTDEEAAQNSSTELPQAAPRARCFFDVKIGILPAGRIVFELYSDVVPMTCENFRCLCTGEKGIGKTTEKPLYYKSVIFHRVVKDFMIQAGDFSNNNGTGGESIYGGTFDDEEFQFKHDKPFLLSMANRGKNTNGSQFFITTQPASHLDNIHVVFGHVVSGHDIVRQIEALPVDRNSRPLQDVIISNCGELIKQIKVKKVKKKKEVSKSASDSESSDEEKKKKSKSKKKKKKAKSEDSDNKSGSEEGEVKEPKLHPMVSVTNIDKDEIPEVSNKFLMRGGHDRDGKSSTKNKDQRDKNSSDREKRFGWSKRNVPTSRSGRIIKGRGSFRYRTPSRSKSRSRSVTPPHWRNAQKRTIKLSDLQKMEEEKRVREVEIRRREAERRKRHEQAEEMARQGAKKSFFEISSSMQERQKDLKGSGLSEESNNKKSDMGKDLDLNALDYEHNPDDDWDNDPKIRRQSTITVQRVEVQPKERIQHEIKEKDRPRRIFHDDRRKRVSRSRSRGRRSPIISRNRLPVKDLRARQRPGRFDQRNRSRSYTRRSRSRNKRSRSYNRRSRSRDRPHKASPRRSRSNEKSRLDKPDLKNKQDPSPSRSPKYQHNILPDSAPRDPSPKTIPLPKDSPPPMPPKELTEEEKEREKARVKKEKMLKRAETLLLLKSHMEKEIAEQRRREKEKEKAKEEQDKIATELQQLERLKKETLEKLKQHDDIKEFSAVKDVINAVVSSATVTTKKKSRRSRSSSSSYSSNSDRDRSKKRKHSDNKKKKRGKRSRS